MTPRALTPDDWRAFDSIRCAMLAEKPSAFGSTLANWQRKSEAEKRDWIASNSVFAILDADRCLSVAAYNREPGAKARHRALIISVYSRPEARRQGHIRRLLSHMEDVATREDILQLELETPTWNAAAIAAYRAAGYQQVGIVPRAMRDDDGFVDDVMMVKALDGVSLAPGTA